VTAPPAPVIRIVLNGETAEVAAGATFAGLLARLGRDPRTVAVEHNGAILARARYAQTVLEPGDRLEVVAFVQGG
jgi:sulfur carrier protein